MDERHTDDEEWATMPIYLEGFRLATWERACIEACIAAYGSREAVARELGISPATLDRKIRAYGLPPARDGRRTRWQKDVPAATSALPGGSV